MRLTISSTVPGSLINTGNPNCLRPCKSSCELPDNQPTIRSGLRESICSTSNRLWAPITGSSFAAGGKSLYSTTPTTCSPAPIKKRISVMFGARLTTRIAGEVNVTLCPASSTTATSADTRNTKKRPNIAKTARQNSFPANPTVYVLTTTIPDFL